MSELHRAIVRIIANYAGLAITMVFAFALVPMLLAIGNSLFGAVALLGATVGIAAMLRDIVRASLIREVGSAWHTSREVFLEAYNSACLLSLCAAFFTLAVFALLAWGLIPQLNFPKSLAVAAQWFVWAKGIETFFVVALAPTFNMYLIEERMIALNVWRVANQACLVVAAGIVMWMDFRDEARALIWYGGVSAVLVCLVVFSASALLVRKNPDLWPSFKFASRDAIRTILRVGGWNTAVRIANALHIRLDAIIMNVFFGVAGNQVFGAANIMSSYTRRVAAGLTTGLDAVSTRLSTSASQDGAIQKLIHHSTRLHALIVFPTLALVLLLATPFTELWISQRLDDPGTQIPLIVLLINILIVGRAARSLGDGWMGILYGAGFVARYAPMIIAGGILNPAVAVALVYTLPENLRIAGPALSYSAILLVGHGVLLPLIAARCMAVRPRHIFMPLVRPIILTTLTSLALMYVQRFVHVWSWASLAGVVMGYCIVYGGLSYVWFLRASEKKRIADFVTRIRRRLLNGRQQT